MQMAFVENGIVMNLAEFAGDTLPDGFAAPAGVTVVPVGEDRVDIGAEWDESNGFSMPSPTLEELQARALAAVNAKRDAVLSGGYQHNFGGSAGIRTLDTRTDRDRLNWIVLKGQVKDLVEAGEGDTDIAIRDAGNETFTTSATTTLTALSGLEQWGAAVLSHSWALKDEIAAAEDAEALASIDLEAAWPD